MAWSKISMRLDTARVIFTGVDIQEMQVFGEVAGYRATFGDAVIERKTLTAVCQALWDMKGEVKGA